MGIYPCYSTSVLHVLPVILILVIRLLANAIRTSCDKACKSVPSLCFVADMHVWAGIYHDVWLDRSFLQ